MLNVGFNNMNFIQLKNTAPVKNAPVKFINKPLNADTVSFGSSQKIVTKVLKEIEDKIRHLPNEELFMINNSGEILLHAQGDKQQVKTTGNLYDALLGAIATHNHPEPGTFSIPDILMANKFKLKEIRATNPDDKTYSLIFNNKHISDYKISELSENINEDLAIAMQKYEREAKELWPSDSESKKNFISEKKLELRKEINHKIIQKAAEHYGWTYQVEKAS